MISEMIMLLNSLLEEYKKSQAGLPFEAIRVIDQQQKVINLLTNKINSLVQENNRLKKYQTENINNEEVKL